MREVDLRQDGLLWLINRVVFHPRGYSLGFDEGNKEFFLLGDGTETYTFGAESVETPYLNRVKDLMP